MRIVLIAVVGISVATATLAQERADPPVPRPPTALSVQALQKYQTTAAAKIDPKLVAAGKVVAVAPSGASSVISVSPAAAPNRDDVFRVFKRARIERVAVPPMLIEAGGAAQANLLRADVVAPSLTGEAVEAQAYVRDSTGLIYVGARNRFEGRLDVALATTAANAPPELARVVSVSLRAPAAAKIDPSPVNIVQLNRWHPVALAVAQPMSPYRVAVSAHRADPGDEIDVAVERPSITLAPRAPRMFGFGLSSMTIAVAANNVQEPDGTIVNLVTDRGAIESGPAKLDAQGQGSITLRSAGIGTATVRAVEPFMGTPLRIEFESPWLFAVLALVGGLIGAFLTHRGRRARGRALAMGALVGLVMATAYVVGLDWVVKATGVSALASAGEAVVFVLGVLGALVGVKLLVPQAGGGR